MTQYEFSAAPATSGWVENPQSLRRGGYTIDAPIGMTEVRAVATREPGDAAADTIRLSTSPQTLSAARDGGMVFALNASAMAHETKIRALTREVEHLSALRENRVAEAAGDAVAMFILTKIVEAEDLDMEVLAENLVAPNGWLSFAQLWRADLIDCYGSFVVPTDTGIQLARRFATKNANPANTSRGEQ